MTWWIPRQETRASRLGCDVEVCPACHELRVFDVWEHRRHARWLGLSLSSGRRLGASLSCRECGAWLVRGPSDPIRHHETEKLDVLLALLRSRDRRSLESRWARRLDRPLDRAEATRQAILIGEETWRQRVREVGERRIRSALPIKFLVILIGVIVVMAAGWGWAEALMFSAMASLGIDAWVAYLASSEGSAMRRDALDHLSHLLAPLAPSRFELARAVESLAPHGDALVTSDTIADIESFLAGRAGGNSKVDASSRPVPLLARRAEGWRLNGFQRL